MRKNARVEDSVNMVRNVKMEKNAREENSVNMVRSVKMKKNASLVITGKVLNVKRKITIVKHNSKSMENM